MSAQPLAQGVRWIYRDGLTVASSCVGGLSRGLCDGGFTTHARGAIVELAEEEYSRPKRRAFIDVDPGFTQITIANGDQGWAEGIARCERRFT